MVKFLRNILCRVNHLRRKVQLQHIHMSSENQDLVKEMLETLHGVQSDDDEP